MVSIRQAVRKVSGKAPASSQESPAGLRRRFWAGTWKRWQAVPSVCSPKIPKPGQSTCCPARQASHSQSQATG